MPPTPEPPTTAHARPRVGRYLLQSRIGVGATSTAWRARDERGTEVCLKLLHPRLLSDASARTRFAAEAAAAADLDHPAIVPVLEFISTDSEAALVFPFLEGETLAARLAREKRLMPKSAARIAADVAGALAAIHGRGVIHRDVKPSNILLTTDTAARLFDFGIAYAPDAAPDGLTGDGMTVGTLPYMSPEQLAGLDATPGNDVFALGAVLYEMLAGRRPYDAATPTELAEAHTRPPDDVAGAPRGLLAIAWSALARDANARPHASQVLEALERWLTDGRLPAPPGRLAGRPPA